MENFTLGQKVKYNGKETQIDVLHGDGTCNIVNPDWTWDDESECIANNVEYGISYWTTVKLSELSV